MKDFFKTIILVAVFYGLILFSFVWFNKGEKDLKSVPYVQEFFNIVDFFTENINKNLVDNWESFRFLDRKREKNDNLLPNSSEGWENYLNN
jgi:hypothetical protein